MYFQMRQFQSVVVRILWKSSMQSVSYSYFISSECMCVPPEKLENILYF